jgi:DNA-binding NtrC family response regulator
MSKERLPLETLIVEDDPTMQAFLREVAAGLGVRAEIAANGREAIEKIGARRFDLILSDVRLPGASGIEILKAARAVDAKVEVVLITAYATVELAIEALRAGADDFLQKPFAAEMIEAVFKRAAERRELRRDSVALKRMPCAQRLVGRERGLREVVRIIEKVAGGEANVLIQGESGVGKELVAREIHRLSPRADRRLVALHVPAVPETLIEAELFGHVKGAFTGAIQERVGLLELADAGTLFLDEVGDLGPAVQSKLLRFLQERTYRRIGSNAESKVDVRIICATNRDLAEEVRAGRFREDLFYRLNVVPIRVPPLRERREDIPELVEHVIATRARSMNSTIRTVAPLVMDQFRAYPWPGNVRELENVVCRALALESGEVLERSHLENAPLAAGGIEASMEQDGFSLPEHLAAIERRAIERALELSSGRQAAAAARLGLKRTTLVEKISRLGIEGARRRK